MTYLGDAASFVGGAIVGGLIILLMLRRRQDVHADLHLDIGQPKKEEPNAE